MSGILVDSNVLLDVFTQDPVWAQWSLEQLEHFKGRAQLLVNQVVYAEMSVSFGSIEELDVQAPSDWLIREPIPFEAAFLAG